LQKKTSFPTVYTSPMFTLHSLMLRFSLVNVVFAALSWST
jgi:hypothetical protein